MVIKKSFTLLVARTTTRFFAFVSKISVNGCRNDAEYSMRPIDTTSCREKLYKHRFRSVISDVRRIIGNVVSLRLCTTIRARLSMLMSMRVIRYKSENQSNNHSRSDNSGTTEQLT